MINTYEYKGAKWIELDHPTEAEVETIMEDYKIDPTVAKELFTPTPKPRIEAHSNFIFAILHFPVFKHSHSHGSSQELDFIVGRDFVITTRYDTIDSIHRFSKLLEADAVLNKEEVSNPSSHIFFRILQEMYKSLFDELSFMEDWLKEIESTIFKGKEKEMVSEISRVSRTLLDFKSTTVLHRELLESMGPAGAKLFGEHFKEHSNYLADQCRRIHNNIKNYMEWASELRETNNSLITTKQNEVMKVLTIMAFVTFPLSLIAGIFGMNTGYTPIVGRPNDFWIVVGIMLFMALSFFMFFKYKKWL